VDLQRAKFIFDDNYVPLRLPTTICVEERLPPGAAGVFLNRNHPFHDLILVIDAKEKSIFDRIDGRHSIADLVAGDRESTVGVALCGHPYSNHRLTLVI
jgi:hypothetical protein